MDSPLVETEDDTQGFGLDDQRPARAVMICETSERVSAIKTPSNRSCSGMIRSIEHQTFKRLVEFTHLQMVVGAAAGHFKEEALQPLKSPGRHIHQDKTGQTIDDHSRHAQARASGPN